MKKNYSIILQSIALLFIIAQGFTGTAYAQAFSIDSCTGIHYTDTMDKQAIECIINAPKKDSIISHRGDRIDILEFAINKKVEENELCDGEKTGLKTEVIDLKTDLGKCRKNGNTKMMFVGAIGVVLGVLVGSK